jgi:hypothetical protein
MDEERERIMDDAEEIVTDEQERLFLLGVGIIAVACVGIAIAVGVSIGKRTGGGTDS